MLTKDCAAEFLNLENVIITNVENISEQLHFSIELPRRKHICPCCGVVTDRVHDYRMQVIKVFQWQEIPSCICVSGGIAGTAARVSSSVMPFYPATTELQAVL